MKAGTNNPTGGIAIRTVAPSIWQPLWAAALKAEIAGAGGSTAGSTARRATVRLDQEAVAVLARSTLARLHDRHIPITPEMAVGLAAALLSRSEILPSPWDEVAARLEREAAAQSGLATTAHAIAGLHTHFRYTLFRLVVPLIGAAAEAVGEILLFANDPEGASVAAATYRQYAEALTQAVRALADENTADNPLGSTFWADRALSLVGLANAAGKNAGGDNTLHGGDGRQEAAEDDPAARLPQTDLAATGLLLRLQPQAAGLESLVEQPLPPTERRTLFDRRRQEAGVSGAHLTKQVEAVSRMLQSEYLYPDLIRLDRLLNSGFMATQRPPRPIQRRDILLVALFPPEVEIMAGEPMAVFARAAWFHLLVQLCRLLTASGRNASELRVAEGDGFRRLRTHTVRLADLPESLGRGQFDAAILRAQLLSGVGANWFPAYLDQSGQGWQTLPEADASAGDRIAGVKSWLRAAWQAQRDHRAWENSLLANDVLSGNRAQLTLANSMGERRLASGQFDLVYRMVFLPAALIQDGEGSSAGDNAGQGISIAEWRSVFGDNPRTRAASARDRRSSLGIMGVPGGGKTGAWPFSGDTNAAQVAHTNEPDALAGQLCETWMEDLLTVINEGNARD